MNYNGTYIGYIIQPICSLESKLQIDCVCYIGIPSRNRDIVKKPIQAGLVTNIFFSFSLCYLFFAHSREKSAERKQISAETLRFRKFCLFMKNVKRELGILKFTTSQQDNLLQIFRKLGFFEEIYRFLENVPFLSLQSEFYRLCVLLELNLEMTFSGIFQPVYNIFFFQR